MSQRTDVHRPSVIHPGDYEFVAFEYVKVESLGDAIVLKQQREIVSAHMAHTGGRYSGHEHGGNCMVCGNANAIYTVLFYHRPTNTYVRTGQDCAEKMDLACEGFDAFKRRISEALEARAGKAKAEKLLSEAGLSRAWSLYAEPPADRAYEEFTIADIVGKLVRYGSISDSQKTLVGKLLAQIDTRAEREAEQKRQNDAAAPCPTGRVVITGTVLAVKEREGYAGRTETKLLIQADEGFKVWGNRFNNFEKGDRIRFTATIEVSEKDAKFGFFKRPVKAEYVFAEPADNELVPCPTCAGESEFCGLCGTAHVVKRGIAKRYDAACAVSA